ncbi:MAG: PadR family transcriptional regulator [Leptolyngbya sp. SIO4C1]|nr:PadR family transcriptional regulator [Leptolyngbya sp. SIO4C1]
MALPYAILAVLTQRPYSGYDLAKCFDSTVGFIWSASHQQIYRELTKLAAQHYVRSEPIPQEGRPNKKLYSITAAGQAALQAWVLEPSPAHPLRDELLIKLFSGSLVPKDAIVTALKQRYRQHRISLEAYQTRAQRYSLNPVALSDAEKLKYATIRAGIHYEMAKLSWCEETIRLLIG